MCKKEIGIYGQNQVQNCFGSRQPRQNNIRYIQAKCKYHQARFSATDVAKTRYNQSVTINGVISICGSDYDAK